MTRRFRRYILASAVASVVMALLGAAVAYAFGRDIGQLPAAAALGAVGALIACALAFGTVLALEMSDGAAHDVRLLELASPGHPLLKRLMLDAPGTYSHSVLVGYLVEQAAETIGADPLLARVGAYYHDIGKLHRPEYFVENQSGQWSPHEKTSPQESALVITSHVQDGVALAKAYGLPEEVRAIIREHHGTSLVTYFFEKACQLGPMSEMDFRYTGGVPTSREAALVMLADASEAAVRCVRTPTVPRVESVVRHVLDQRLADHQLDQAGLSVSDMERVVRVYARMLVSMSHPRIEYPLTEA